MNLIDEQFKKHPEMGVASMVEYLRQDCHKKCGPKRISRLIRQMSLEPIYPKPDTSKPNKAHNVYIKGYQTMQEAREGLEDYFGYYTHHRRHQALNYARPWNMYTNHSELAA